MSYKSIVRSCSRIGNRYMSSYLAPLKTVITKSNLSIIYDIYVGKMILFSILGFVISFFIVASLMIYFSFGLAVVLVAALLISLIAFTSILVLFHSYPFEQIRSRRMSIETNMPFATNHMAAIASSGVPPVVLFKLISSVKDYKEFSNECARVVRNIEVFGMDTISAIKNVAERTPSEELKKFLFGIVATIETGGQLTKFLESSAKDSLFDYKIKRETYLQTLATYADIYTAVLIAAPLFFVSVLSIMALVGGQVFGLDIPTALRVGIYGLIPVLNIAFLVFISYTQPKS